MGRWFRHLISGVDNSSPDFLRVLSLVGVLAFIVYAGVSVWKTGVFNAMDYGTGLGATLAGAGVGIWAKREAEPKESKDVDNTAG